MANVCGCGCGELLPEGSTRQYKRGHKSRVTNPETFTETPVEESPEEDSGEFTDAAPGPLTIEDAARLTPDDAEPREAPEFKPKTVLRVTAAMRRDIEGKLAFGLAMSGQLWATLDPVCAGVFLEISPNVAKKLTPIVCQSPEVVKWLTKTGNFMLWVDLFMALMPLLQIVFAHHIVKTITNDLVSQNGNRPAPSEYVVQ